jgi:glycosyltransferase involved in cell wall biosynthesis
MSLQGDASRRVFLYTSLLPQRTGSGAHLRIFSNVRAWLDLGFDVEIVKIGSDVGEPPADSELARVQWCFARGSASRSLHGRLAYRFGVCSSAACAYYFHWHTAALREVRRRAALFPGSLHQFEGDDVGNVIPFISGLHAVLSAHDISSGAIAASQQIGRELGGPNSAGSDEREHRFFRRIERRIAAASRLVLCISTADHEVMRSEWGIGQAEYLPMSVGDEMRFSPGRQWTPAGTLRLLHLGSVAHLPSYRSLEWLLTCVLPRLDAGTRARVSVRVVGHIDEGNARCRRSLALGQRFGETVSFTGYVPDVAAEYAGSDLQIVCSTESSGLRTRIVESFAYGLPVLSTRVAARGLDALSPGENILLEDDPARFAENLQNLTADPTPLPRIAAAARNTYCRHYSRSIVAARLKELLSRYFDPRPGKTGVRQQIR